MTTFRRYWSKQWVVFESRQGSWRSEDCIPNVESEEGEGVDRHERPNVDQNSSLALEGVVDSDQQDGEVDDVRLDAHDIEHRNQQQAAEKILASFQRIAVVVLRFVGVHQQYFQKSRSPYPDCKENLFS